MKIRLAILVIVFVSCTLVVQANTIAVGFSGVHEPGTRAQIRITCTDGNGAAVGVPITVDGNISYSGVTDGRGQVHIYVIVPSVSRLNFMVHWGLLEQEAHMDIAIGTWEEEKNLNGNFAGGYSISADSDVWPTVSWAAACANVAANTSEHKKGNIPAAAVNTSNIDLTLGICGSYITSAASSSVTGGVALTEIKTFRFMPTFLGGKVPSKSVLHRSCTQLRGLVTSYLIGEGASSASLTAVGAFSPPIVLKASSGTTGNDPVNKSITLPDTIVSGGTIPVPMSRAGSGQCSFHCPGVPGWEGQSTVSRSSLNINETATRSAWSIELPRKAGG